MHLLIYNRNHKNSNIYFRAVVILTIFMLLLQHTVFTPVFVLAMDDGIETEDLIILHDELTSDAAINILNVSNELEVRNSVELQVALDSDVYLIKIAPENGEDYITLKESLKITKDCNIILIADKPVKITGMMNDWLVRTKSGINIAIQFINVTLDGNNNCGGIYNQGRMSLENVIIQNCKYKEGGGIYSVNDLNVNNCTFIDNAANYIAYGDGGAIYARGLNGRITANIINTNFIRNNGSYGGAVRIDNADGDIINCEFLSNTSAYQGSCVYIASSNINATNILCTNNTGSGAFLANNSILTLTDCDISNNYGRGIYCYTSGIDTNVTLKGDTIVRNNTAAGSYGGGIIGFCEGAGKIYINLEDDTEISENTADYGGGVSSYPKSYVIINMSDRAKIINNRANKDGGGIYGYGEVNINSGQISSNQAQNGGGIYGDKDTSIIIRDAVINNNIAEQDGGGIWVFKLENLSVFNSDFNENKASTGYFWRMKDAADDKQLADSAIHNEKILKTTYTAPYINAYSNYDINYKTSLILIPYKIIYNGNNDDNNTVLTDENNPYLYGEEILILAPPVSLIKSGYYFVGWNTEPNGTGDNYLFNEETSAFSPSAFIMGDEDITLYAQWQEIKNESPEEPEIEQETEQETEQEANDNLKQEEDDNSEQEINDNTNQENDKMGIIIKYPKWPEPNPFNYTAKPKPQIDLEQYPEEQTQIPELHENTELNQTPLYNAVSENLSNYSPDYQLIELDNSFIKLEDTDTPVIPGEQLSTNDGLVYQINNNNPEQVIKENESLEVLESIEVLDQNDTPIGLWSKNEDDEWVYEEYVSINNIIKLIILIGLILFLFFIIISRKRVSREEFIRMLIPEVGLDVEINNIEPYKDVSEDAVYYLAVMNAKSAGLLIGFEYDEFKPHVAITREEMAGILTETARYAGVTVTNENINLEDVFIDSNKLDKKYWAAVCFVAELGIIQGTPNGKFNPKGLSNKRQVKNIIKRLVNAISPSLPLKNVK